MVGTLIRWSLLDRRRRARGVVLATLYLFVGLAVLLLALGTAGLPLLDADNPRTAGDLLAAVLGGWGFCWLVLPLVFGSVEAPAPEDLALLPLPRRRLALGLCATALVSPGALLTALTLVCLPVFGASRSVSALIVGVLAAGAELLMFVLLSKVLTTALGVSLRSRRWRLVGQLGFAVIVTFSWLLRLPLVGLGDRLVAGTAPVAAWWFRVVPSGWAVDAVDAAGRADVVGCVAPLAALLASCAVLLLVWSAMVRRRLAGVRPTEPVGHGREARAVSPSRTPVRGVVRRELLLWFREDRRTMALLVTVCAGLALGLVMAAAGVPAMAPFGALCAVVVGCCVTANLYGLDGGGIWVTLVAPDSASADVRGRQLGWLSIMAPICALLALLGVVVGGMAGLPVSPAALALSIAPLPAVLGAGAGAVVLFSALIPYRLPTGRLGGQLPFPLIAGPQQVAAMLGILVLITIAATPALAVVLLGVPLHTPLLMWLGVPAGIAAGGVAMRALTGPAVRALRRRAPEILRAVATTA